MGTSDTAIRSSHGAVAASDRATKSSSHGLERNRDVLESPLRSGRIAGDLRHDNEVPLSHALSLCALLLEPQMWIHRRVEQVSYLDHNTVRRRITVDFDIPAFATEAGETRYLPIAQIAKRKLVNFDMRDADGAALTTLTAAQNSRLSDAMLLALARLEDPGLVDWVVEKYIPILVRATDHAERTLAWRRIFQPGTPVAEHLLEKPGFVAVAADLATNFVLYLPVTARDAGRRRIVKIAFDSARPVLDRSDLRVRLGWRDAQDSFRVPLAGYCSSYHFELEAPMEMEITDGTFVAASAGKPAIDRLSAASQRVSFNLANLDRSSGRVAVHLRARSTMLSGIAAVSALNAAALLFVWLRLHGIMHEDHGASLVPALIAIPGILLGYITRPSEHAMVTSFLSDLRRVTLFTGATSFAAALLLVSGFKESDLRLVFAGVVVMASLAALILLVSWYVAHRRR